ncbi:MAG: barstar family protein [Pirellulaceae bacterium]
MSGDAANTVVANIPASVRSKQRLLRILANQLQFPSYFGNNWDALEECLRDLSWLPAGNIVIHHCDMPLPPGSPDRKIYLQILESASTYWAESKVRSLNCSFPEDCQTESSSAGA